MSAKTRSERATVQADGSAEKAGRASVASFLGSMLEYYDFVIYGAAASLIFTHVFFTESAPGAGMLLSLATFGVAYVARPLGALVLGHIGDRVGRRRVMMFTIILMGVCTFLIGCIPGYDSWGVLAPILLVVCRLAQGFSAGGEQSGANAIILEHAPSKRRNFFASWTMTGTTVGTVIATLVFVPVAALPDEILYSWGWRVPFWASAVVVVVAYVVRRRLEEPEAYEAVKNQGERAALPVVELMRTHWAALIRLILCAMTAALGTIFQVFGLAYATEQVGLDRTVMLWVTIVSNVTATVLMPFLAILSDRIGRRPVYIAGTLGLTVTVFAYFAAIGTGFYPLIFACGLLMNGLAYSAVIIVGTAFYPEMFPTAIRFSGSALGTQIGYAMAGFAPTIGYAIMGTGQWGWIPVAVMGAIICLVATAMALITRESAGAHIDELGYLGRTDRREALA